MLFHLLAKCHAIISQIVTHCDSQKRVQKALDPFLKKSGKSWSDVEGIRITRYGHAIPVAQSGMIASGTLESAHATINNKIYFANQDNWANPCFETSYATGTLAAHQATNRDIKF